MRKETIADHKQEHGRKVLGVLPILYPKEILTALDILAVEVWGPPGPPRGASAGRIQTYVCPVVRNAMAFLTDGGAESVDGLLIPHTCDSLQGLATVLPDFGHWKKPLFRFIHPKGERRQSTEGYMKNELKSLTKDLEAFSGRSVSSEALWRAIRLHRDIDGLRAELLQKREQLPFGARELYTLLRRGEWLWPEDHLAELKEAAKRLGEGAPQKGVPVFLSGIVPEPMNIFDALEQAGARIVGDDYAALSRRILPTPATMKNNGDPFDALTELAFSAPPCSTRASLVDFRRARLLDSVKASGAKGVIFHIVKFCEPELFDLPHMTKALSERKIPYLVVESELEAELSGQTVTRLEAFVETAMRA